MSNYGPPGGPYPGPPQQPWPTGQPNDAYGQPSDPWGGQNPSGPGTSPTTPAGPGGYDPGYGGYHDPGNPGYAADQNYGHSHQPGGADPAWAPPPAAPPAGPTKSGKGPVIALVAAIAVLLVGIGATAIYLLGQQDGETPDRPATQASSEPSPIGEPSATGEPAPTEPAAEASTNTLFVKVGQCVKDEGTSGKPELVITECGAKTYEVLARFDGVTSGGNDAKAKCAKITGYTNWYFFNSELDTLDFVLCLKNR